MAGSGGKKSGGKKKSGARGLHVRVKTARGRTTSSARWLERQLNDPYVAAAKRDGYRSRAAYKIIEIDDKHHFLKTGARVVDLGAAPGGWCQVAATRVKSLEGKGRVIGVDLQEVESIPGTTQLHLDFMEDGADDKVKEVLDGEADVVLSDMAASSTGHRQTDHLKIIALCEAAAQFAREVLAEGGTFCAKVLQGGTEGQLLDDLKRDFTTVRHVKPAASRADSAEMYVLATGFRGRPQGEEGDDEA